MKKILFVLVLLCLEKTLHAQTPRTPYVYTIKADSVKITNTCDTAELIIENHTQTVPGFLFNKGRGRTEFRRISQFDDTTVVIGGDTVHLGRGYKNFANADLTFDGDHYHDGAFHTLNLANFDAMGFQSNATDGTVSTAMNMDTRQYTVELNNTGNPNNLYYSYLGMSKNTAGFGASRTTPNFMYASNIGTSENTANLSNGQYDLNTGDGTSVGIMAGILTDYDPREIDMYSNNGTMRIYTTSSFGNPQIEMNFHSGQYLTTLCNQYGIGSSLVSQDLRGFTFSAVGSLSFKLPGLPVSTYSQDSVLVISDSGQVKKRAQSSVTPSLNITEVDIVDITAQPDAVTKLPNLQSHAGHSVSLPPAANYAGKKIYIWNQNASVNVWTFSASITLPDGSTSNVIPNQSTIELLSDGNVWLKWK